jgi:hypothetical protein
MRSLALLSLAFLVACASQPGVETATTTTTVLETTTTPSAPTTEPTIGCPEDAAFVDRGRVTRIDQPSSDTNMLGLISWEVDEGCEQFGIGFETTEGAPATTPPTIVVEFLESRQILRVWTDVGSTVVTDQLVETSLVDRLFVVRALDGRMFIDFHLVGPAQASATISNSPALLTVELQAGADLFVPVATISERAVVITPRDGSETGTTVQVEGYARTFEANVLILATIGDEVVAQANATAADWVVTWGEFRATIQLPTGEVSLFVGEESPEDGRLDGAALNLTVR